MAKKVTQKDIRRVQQDAQKELWGVDETLFESAQLHLESITTNNSTGTTYDRNNMPNDVLSSNADIRMEFIRGNLSDAIEDLLEDLDEARDGVGLPEAVRRNRKNRKNKKNKKAKGGGGGRHRAKKKRRRRRRRRRKRALWWWLLQPQPPGTPGTPTPPTNPNTPQPPTPVPPDPDDEDDEDEVDEVIPPLTPPDPRPVESPPPPPPPRRVNWDSRVGYFVALSDLTWYEEVPRIIESPFVDIDFNDTPEGFLRLREGESWQSEWFDTGVIRGLNIDVMGKHKLNYSKNGDFEI
jgi:hypothetical protein